MAGRLMLLDSASLYFRAFFGVPDSLRAPDGTVVNAVRGMLDFVAALTAQYRPDAIVAAWDDDWRPAWRVELIPSYKTHRLVEVATGEEEVPDLLSPQVPLIAEALTLLGVPVVGAEGAEADDVIGSLAKVWAGPVDIVTGDRDLFQLVDDDHPTRVLYTARGVGNHDVVDAAWIRAKYAVEPHQYVDFAVMRGDTSDGLPGVPGIGEKTAASLLAAYGDLDAIQAAAGDPASDLRPRIRQSLLDSRDYVEAARTVVAVREDVATVDAVVPRAPLTGEATEAFTAFGTSWGLGGVPARVIEALGSDSVAS
ncbi:MAG TPA: 5'-3' exonuclease [Aeromicrobium sp.]|nr:5'-3' exonuclease [Aeromicrobium sp.]